MSYEKIVKDLMIPLEDYPPCPLLVHPEPGGDYGPGSGDKI
jgi:hypothetical protein